MGEDRLAMKTTLCQKDVLVQARCNLFCNAFVSATHRRSFIAFRSPGHIAVVDIKDILIDIERIFDQFLQDDQRFGAADVDNPHPDRHVEVRRTVESCRLLFDNFVLRDFEENNKFVRSLLFSHPRQLRSEGVL